jgi:hypothetical protein
VFIHIDPAGDEDTGSSVGRRFGMTIQQKRTMIMSTVFVMTFLIVFGWHNAVEAQPAMLDRPLKLRVTGELLVTKKQPAEDLVTANVIVNDKPMMLRVGKVEELTSSEREQAVKWGVLFRQVRFYGPMPLLEQIAKEEGTGKALIIEGNLDTKARQFLVTSVQDATAAPRHPAATK